MTAEAVRTDTPVNKLSILIFDDGATFEYVEEIASEFLEVSTCRSFADLADYLVAVSSGEKVSPDILALDLYCDEALLHKSADGRSSPFPGQTYPTGSVTGMPSAVYPFRTAIRT